MTMRDVSKDEFFAAIGPLNVHPRPERDITYWETPRRVLVGTSTPGYMGTGEKTFSLTTTEGTT